MGEEKLTGQRSGDSSMSLKENKKLKTKKSQRN